MPSSSPLQQGVRVGRYLLQSRLATGGMADVWLATATGVSGFQKTVVLKTILPHLAQNPEFVRMFINEALLAAVLDHPNIVHIFDLGQFDDAYFIAMEYISGRTLRQIQRELRRSKRRVPPPWFALHVAASVCDALDYAHNKKDDAGHRLGLVHRDVTPENIMVAFSGETKVLDFGIAKANTAAMSTQVGTLKGKFAYMAPEQITGAGQGTVANPQFDVYALGVVLYEMLTGKRPFGAPNELALLKQILEEVPPAPSSLASWIPKGLEAIILRAMDRDPKSRFQSAAEMRGSIEEFLSSRNMHPTPRHVGEYVAALFAQDQPAAPRSDSKAGATGNGYRPVTASSTGLRTATSEVHTDKGPISVEISVELPADSIDVLFDEPPSPATNAPAPTSDAQPSKPPASSKPAVPAPVAAAPTSDARPTKPPASSKPTAPAPVATARSNQPLGASVIPPLPPALSGVAHVPAPPPPAQAAPLAKLALKQVQGAAALEDRSATKSPKAGTTAPVIAAPKSSEPAAPGKGARAAGKQGPSAGKTRAKRAGSEPPTIVIATDPGSPSSEEAALKATTPASTTMVSPSAEPKIAQPLARAPTEPKPAPAPPSTPLAAPGALAKPTTAGTPTPASVAAATPDPPSTKPAASQPARAPASTFAAAALLPKPTSVARGNAPPIALSTPVTTGVSAGSLLPKPTTAARGNAPPVALPTPVTTGVSAGTLLPKPTTAARGNAPPVALSTPVTTGVSAGTLLPKPTAAARGNAPPVSLPTPVTAGTAPSPSKGAARRPGADQRSEGARTSEVESQTRPAPVGRAPAGSAGAAAPDSGTTLDATTGSHAWDLVMQRARREREAEIERTAQAEHEVGGGVGDAPSAADDARPSPAEDEDSASPSRERSAWDRLVQQARRAAADETTHPSADDEGEALRERSPRHVWSARRAAPESGRAKEGGPGPWTRRSTVAPEVQALRLFDEGLELMKARDYEGARAAWLKAAELDPTNRMIQGNLRTLKKLMSDGGKEG